MSSILKAFTAFTPDQWAMIAAIVISSPVAQYCVTEYSKYLAARPKLKENLNWLLSIAFPALGTIATFLVTSPDVNHAFPIFATLYTLGQGVYLASVRFVKKAKRYQDLYESSVSPKQL